MESTQFTPTSFPTLEDTTECLSNEDLDLSSPTNLLVPPEILTLIFHYYVSEFGASLSRSTGTSGPPNPVNPVQLRLLLVQICRSWRRAALSTWTVWTDMAFKFDSRYHDNNVVDGLALLDDWLARTGDTLPLNVDLVVPNEQSFGARGPLQPFVPVTHRVRTLTLKGPVDQIFPFMRHVASNMTSLVSLELMLELVSLSSCSTLVDNDGKAVFKQSSALKTVKLHCRRGASMSFDNPWANAFMELVELPLPNAIDSGSDPEFNGRSGDDSSGTITSLDLCTNGVDIPDPRASLEKLCTFNATLVECRLEIGYITFDMGNALPPLNQGQILSTMFPSLRVLGIHRCSRIGSNSFITLDWLTAPSLSVLELNSIPTPSIHAIFVAVKDLLDRSCSSESQSDSNQTPTQIRARLAELRLELLYLGARSAQEQLIERWFSSDAEFASLNILQLRECALDIRPLIEQLQSNSRVILPQMTTLSLHLTENPLAWAPFRRLGIDDSDYTYENPEKLAEAVVEMIQSRSRDAISGQRSGMGGLENVAICAKVMSPATVDQIQTLREQGLGVHECLYCAHRS